MAPKIILLCLLVRLSVCQEPQCTSFTFLEQLLEKLVRLESRVQDLETPFVAKGQQHQTEDNISINEKSMVAFMATQTNRQSNMAKNGVIIFDHVITNIGDGYDKTTGIFRAPVDGVYNFQFTVLTDNDEELWGNIAVNGEANVWYNARGTDGRHGSGSQSLVVSLVKDDMVTVKNWGDDGDVYGGYYTSFSGYLISQSPTQ